MKCVSQISAQCTGAQIEVSEGTFVKTGYVPNTRTQEAKRYGHGNGIPAYDFYCNVCVMQRFYDGENAPLGE